MPTEPLVIRFRYTEQEAITATREMTSAVFRFIRFMPWCGALFLILGIIYPVIKGYDILEYLTPIVVGVVLLLTPLQIRFQAKRRFKKSTLAEKIITWQITPDTVRNETDFS